ncbi:MAG: glycosyltransferase family 39 protein [Bacteroidota bacterium]
MIALSSNYYRIVYAILLLCAAGFGLWLIQDPGLHPWDERYHALVGKNLLAHPWRPMLYANPVLPYDYHDWSRSHVWVHKPPVPLYAIALSLKTFGVKVWAVRLPSVLALVATAGLSGWLARGLFGRPVSLLTLGLCGFHGLHLELMAGRTATDHVDIWLSFFTVAGATLAFRYYASGRSTRSYLLLTGVCLGLGLLSKSLPALLILVITSGWAYRQRVGRRAWVSDISLVFLVGMAVAAPWYGYILWAFPAETAWAFTHQFLHFGVGLDDHAQAWYFHLAKAPYVYGQLMIIPLIYASWFGWRYRRHRRGRTLLALLAWLAVPYVIFSLATTKMIAYPIQAALPIFLLTARFVEKYFGKNWVATVGCLLLLLLPIRYTIERSRILMVEERTDYFVREPATFTRSFPPKTILFGTQYPVEAMFHHDLSAAYEKIPTQAVRDSLMARGYHIQIIAKSDR